MLVDYVLWLLWLELTLKSSLTKSDKSKYFCPSTEKFYIFNLESITKNDQTEAKTQVSLYICIIGEKYYICVCVILFSQFFYHTRERRFLPCFKTWKSRRYLWRSRRQRGRRRIRSSVNRRRKISPWWFLYGDICDVFLWYTEH